VNLSLRLDIMANGKYDVFISAVAEKIVI